MDEDHDQKQPTLRVYAVTPPLYAKASIPFLKCDCAISKAICLPLSRRRNMDFVVESTARAPNHLGYEHLMNFVHLSLIAPEARLIPSRLSTNKSCAVGIIPRSRL